jgi:hypothetical protein
MTQSGGAATEVITAEYAEYAEGKAARFGIPRIPRIPRFIPSVRNLRNLRANWAIGQTVAIGCASRCAAYAFGPDVGAGQSRSATDNDYAFRQ